jgi:hypothetical protein
VKTTILADGTLSIAPESGLEAFALNCWAEKNITSDWFNAARPAGPPKIIIDFSGYAEKLGLFAMAGETTR